MELRKNLFTETGWEIREGRFEEELLVTNGSNYMTGNGYLGYRGTFPEWTKDQYVGCTVVDTYDNADGKWTELCTVPNGLYTSFAVDGETVTALGSNLDDYSRELNYRYGFHTRSMQWRSSADTHVTLTDERFAGYGNLHLIPSRHHFTVRSACTVRMTTGIDGWVWSLNGEHFGKYEPFEEQACLFIRTVTQERGVEIVVGETISFLEGEPTRSRTEIGDRSAMRILEFDLDAGQSIVYEKYMVVYTSNDVSRPLESSRRDLEQSVERGFDPLLAEHQAVWDVMWDRSGIDIEGDKRAQALLRYNIYHNIIATPAHADHLPVGARGLSCQAYQGSAFWDQEIFNLPMFLYTRPEVARNLLIYRYKTLNGARKKALDLGFYGAFYAWVSADTGEEVCPSYFFKDVLTGRDIHNHFNDWQIHVSPDIAYTVWRYYTVTGDFEFLKNYGAEILFEVAQFLVSRAHFKKDRNRYEFIRVLGPDEYHENVDNNFFTNYQARHAVRIAATAYDLLREEAPEDLERMQSRIRVNVDAWREMADLIYVKEPGEAADAPNDQVIEQFDGFFQLEDISPEELAERLIDPGEYWGWPNGIAVETQVSKQADVTQLFMLHPQAFSREVMAANVEYYEPRTQHGSSLSPSVYGIVGAWIGHDDVSYDYFIRSCAVDLFNTNKAVSGGTFIGGIHTAACGVAWQIVTAGFLGMDVNGRQLSFAPRLPAGWQRVTCYLEVRGAGIDVDVRRNVVHCTSRSNSASTITVSVAGVSEELQPDSTVSLVC
ncbi:MAG: glycosyl hydrolase family 65 protein [bacterium]